MRSRLLFISLQRETPKCRYSCGCRELTPIFFFFHMQNELEMEGKKRKHHEPHSSCAVFTVNKLIPTCKIQIFCTCINMLQLQFFDKLVNIILSPHTQAHTKHTHTHWETWSSALKTLKCISHWVVECISSAQYIQVFWCNLSQCVHIAPASVTGIVARVWAELGKCSGTDTVHAYCFSLLSEQTRSPYNKLLTHISGPANLSTHTLPALTA